MLESQQIIWKIRSILRGSGIPGHLKDLCPGKEPACSFLQLGNLVIETYEDPVALCDGAINHIALNCLDIEKAYAAAFKPEASGVEQWH